MFEVPDAKRVRREDLYDELASDSDRASQDEEAARELRGKLSAQLSGLLDFDFSSDERAAQPAKEARSQEQAGNGNAGAEDADADEPDELAFEFRLFRDEAPTHTIVIDQHDDQKASGEGAFVVPKRPMSYYMTEGPDSDALNRIRSAAVTPDFIFADAKRRRWGLEKPWRVTHITITAKGGPQVEPKEDDLTEGKRKRPGKKRRIILRTRAKAKAEKEEAAKKTLLDKEEHLKEKKKRLNREKKLKRRAKEKEKKAATKGDGQNAPTEAAPDSTDGDDSEA
ncbi:hypothetical protein JX265_004008 [Neoarthrinium moseri]|uniref:Uncharacterized protein n=1 Tax=Neoarthrinium moseri TaxID=1658444 RepID=A0A9P9WRX8_9PEZI|nr:uncharacterized protein JN550_006761 [Neoarthrinium moseri]KAI1853660.1 hypothetical protein JX266_001644 [Neoarthrinium moseri]KAI1867954.1 hypothetical protein JN550_006761 [Neoarthrinium moseri]KAI1876482.1 hypothetical protein JX265_004008 [Neoarthrinium moseri]